MKVKLEKQPDEDRRDELGISGWSSWGKEASKFDWSYSSTETCYILEGAVTVHLPGSKSVSAEAGDLVQFPNGLSCTWEITSDLRKVFTFGKVTLEPDEVIEVD
ncbi:MAG: cupin domain-containing protein [bacterium]